MKTEKYIRFDWAMKRMLRDKANYAVLEGLLTTLFKEKISINKLLESESNQEDEFDKYNRVDILAENSKGELFIIEVQNNDEYAYFQRMLFGVSKLVTEYINRGEGYQNIKKIYSVNIVYFDLGQGKDYLYHGKTEFLGVNTGEVLNLSPFQRQKFNVDVVSELYPEYYILKVNDFKGEPNTPLEEWIYYLGTGDITNGSTAPGLNEARKKLELALMSKDELSAYYRHLDNTVILKDNIYTSRGEGMLEGRAMGRKEGMREGMEKGIKKGLKKGREEGLAEGLEKGIEKGLKKGREEGREETIKNIVANLKSAGMSIEIIANATGLTKEEIEELL
ncbi:MAG: PD-(D/E)XK nuclease family transposase [Bacteroidales bacterium]|nr:PD-(D/E)XK nuclease family transposase [Bacteroidales bacterium]